MTAETARTTVRTRRSIIAAAATASVAALASSLGRPLPARAVNGDPLRVGATGNAATAATVLSTTAGTGMSIVTEDATYSGVVGIASSKSGFGNGVVGFADGHGSGVVGESMPATLGNHGVAGITHSDGKAGVYGTGVFRGVWGEATAEGATAGVHGWVSSASGAGVNGYATSPTGLAFGVKGETLSTGGYGVYGVGPYRGVYGLSSGSGIGVVGRSDTGTGVKGYATTGYAVHAQGRLKLDRSGIASVPANASYVDVTPTGGLAGTPLGFANLQTSIAGVYVTAVRPNYPSVGKMRITLSKVASTTSTTPVAWMVVG